MTISSQCELGASPRLIAASSTIAANGISSLSRSGERLVASSYDGGIYLVAVEDLSVRNVYRAMTQRVGDGGS